MRHKFLFYFYFGCNQPDASSRLAANDDDNLKLHAIQDIAYIDRHRCIENNKARFVAFILLH